MDLPMILALLVIGSALMAAGRGIRRSRGPARFYWVACAAMFGLGIAATLLIVLVPVATPDDNGEISGEMPPAFGLGLLLAVIGLGGIALGAAVALLRRLWR